MAYKASNTETSLGPYLASLRAAKGLTLREVEDASNKEISNAYLSQLENEKIRKPSPHILHRLAEVYGVSYVKLMEKAGYIVKSDPAQERHGSVPTYAVENLTQDEERALLAYLKLYRTQKPKQ